MTTKTRKRFGKFLIFLALTMNLIGFIGVLSYTAKLSAGIEPLAMQYAQLWV